ncbi:MAG TPA: LPS export ABC transporter periplasmic protein LptC [Caulobacterales bacterium]|nr:LPS export ABC transporter periplasmic protein LptC [Caulobacterales bacterium]
MTHTDAISTWEPRRALSLRQARRRSTVVAGLRRFFVAAAGACFASVFVFMAISTLQGAGVDDRAASEPLRMLNPRFTGRTAEGGPFQITAETALRDRGGRQLVHLDSPVYRAQDGTVVLAPRGVYDETARTIVLNGEVLFSEHGGNRFSTSNMVVDLANGRVHGEQEVTGAGPLGVVRADAYEIRQGDRALVLRGRVRGQIPDRNAPAPQAAPQPASGR